MDMVKRTNLVITYQINGALFAKHKIQFQSSIWNNMWNLTDNHLFHLLKLQLMLSIRHELYSQ